MLNWFNILTIYSNTSILMNKVANDNNQLTACIPLELFVVNKSINDRTFGTKHTQQCYVKGSLQSFVSIGGAYATIFLDLLKKCLQNLFDKARPRCIISVLHT